MGHYKFTTQNEIETMKLAKQLAKQCKTKDIIVLTGNLGSGKTKFTEGLLSYFGVENEISSPTFTIVNEYSKNNINIYHFDVYRLEDSSEFYEIGGEEYFEKGICLIEWGELIQDALPNEYIKIIFEKDENNENARILNINTNCERLEKYIENIKY